MRVSGTERFSLRNRRALVTGASRGIGRAIALAFAEAGADVALCARSLPALDALAGEIRSRGGRALAIGCDVTQPDAVVSGVARAQQELGGIDILVNGAGGPLFQTPVLELRESGWQRTLDLNLTSALRMCQQVGAGMVRQQSGSIINIASLLPTRAWPALAAYSAAKAALLNLTQTLAAAWGDRNVRVNALCPGWIATGLNGGYLADPERAAAAVDAAPLGRWGEVDDVAGAALWLAGDAARYVTGALIPVDGGLAVGLSKQWQQQMNLDD